MSNIRAILFDLDQTLTDRPASIENMCRRFLQTYSERLEPLDFHDLYRHVTDADRGGYRPKEEFYAELSTGLPWKQQTGVAELTQFWQKEFPGCTAARNQAAETLRIIRDSGKLLGVITNGKTEMQNAKIDAMRLREFFSTIAISAQVGMKKPDAEIFQLALRALKVEPSEAVFVGDHPLNDVSAARAVGMRAVWLRGSHDWPREIPPPEFAIDALMEVVALFE